MPQVQEIRIDEYILRIWFESYLVEVRHDDTNADANYESEVPDWVFQSRLAVWLADKDAPIRQRALEGEKIKCILASRVKKAV